MRTAWIELTRACDQRCAFCAAADRLDGAPRPAAALRAELDAAIDQGAERVVFTGGEPLRSAALLQAIAYARGRGARTVVATHGRLLAREELVGRLLAAGLDEAWVSLHGATAATHNALTGGDPLAFAQATEGIARCAGRLSLTVRMVVCARNVDEVPAVIALAAALAGPGSSFELRALAPEGAARTAGGLEVTPTVALQALSLASKAATSAGLRFRHHGFPAWPFEGTPANLHPPPPDASTLRWWADGVVLPAAAAGFGRGDGAWLGELARQRHTSPEALSVELAARRTPALPLSPETPEPPLRGRRVVVLVDRPFPLVWTLGALPALVDALRERGVDASLVSLFDPASHEDPWSAPPPPAPPPTGAMARLRAAWGGKAAPAPPRHPLLSIPEAASDAALEALDADPRVAAADAIVCVHHAAPARLARRTHARFIVLESAPLADLTPGAWREADLVLSATPWRAAAYRAAGVPLERVRFSPAPLRLPWHPRGVGLGAGVLVDPPLPEGPGLTAALRALAEASVIALTQPVHDPVALATIVAAGRPVVGRAQGGVADHAPPGVASILRATASEVLEAARGALERPDQLAELTRGARARAARHDVSHLAAALASGDHGPRAVPGPSGWSSW
jgi:pyruvate-formate lyase-activating enzyme